MQSIGTAIEVNKIMDNAVQAAGIFGQLDQEHVDRIVEKAYRAGFDNRVKLAKMAVEETGIGKWEDKVVKNVVASYHVYESVKNMKTAGIIRDDPISGITEIAQPLGPILGVVPSTNPPSTTIFKILIALKTRNPIILSFHPKAINCCSEAARLLYEAALSEDAPEDCVQWLDHSSIEETNLLMRDKRLALILATGGGALVHAAYSSGTPAIGVGPGNVPAFIEKSADVPFAVEQIIASKTFDNGTICASEQAIVAEKAVAPQVEEELRKQGAYFVPEKDVPAIENTVFDKQRGIMNAAIVGKSAQFIAEKAGLEVPDDTRLLVVKLDSVGKEHPLSSEVLAPVIAYYEAKDFEEAIGVCIDLNFHGGMGHTASIFSNDKERINYFATVMNAGRVVVNTPSSQGAVGGLFNTLFPSFTLGCGSGGRNITTDNITASHLLNIQRVAHRRENHRLMAFDPSLYADESIDSHAFEKEYNKNY